MGPSWSCDQDHFNKLPFPRPKESPLFSLFFLKGYIKVYEIKQDFETVNTRFLCPKGTLGGI